MTTSTHHPHSHAHPHAHSMAGRRAFFDRIAPGWDEKVVSETFLTRLREEVAALGILADETVVDLGCGTGNLTALLVERLGPGGRVVAVDFSPEMLRLAAEKLPGEARVAWVPAEAERLPLPDADLDRVVCFSAWPHFHDPLAVARETWRVLRPGGTLHVLHVQSREQINEIHGRAGGAVAHDLLPPAGELGALLEGAGLEVTEALDAEDRYRVSARRP